MSDTQFRHFDTRRADGVYIVFDRLTRDDHITSPTDYLFQDQDYQEQDQTRLDRFQAGDWGFIGIQAQATITVVRGGVGTEHKLTSAGLWGIESDSEPDYLEMVYQEELRGLRKELADMAKTISELPA